MTSVIQLLIHVGWVRFGVKYGFVDDKSNGETIYLTNFNSICPLQMDPVRRNTVWTVHILHLPLVIHFIWCLFMKAENAQMYHKYLYSQTGVIQKHFMTRSMRLSVATNTD